MLILDQLLVDSVCDRMIRHFVLRHDRPTNTTLDREINHLLLWHIIISLVIIFSIVVLCIFIFRLVYQQLWILIVIWVNLDRDYLFGLFILLLGCFNFSFFLSIFLGFVLRTILTRNFFLSILQNTRFQMTVHSLECLVLGTKWARKWTFEAVVI